MKQWFPLTDYDFYAYLISGMLLIAAVDYTFADGALIQRSQWTVAQGLLWVAIAYLAGQITAAPSAALLEHVVARKWMHAPVDIQLGLQDRNRFERMFAALFSPREYAPLSQSIREKALARAKTEVGEPSGGLTGDSVFQAAFHPVRQNADTAARLAAFQNLYGFSRNVTFAAIIAFALLTIQEIEKPARLTVVLLVSAGVLMLGMFGRFIKFYAAYSGDVLRTYATLQPRGSGS